MDVLYYNKIDVKQHSVYDLMSKMNMAQSLHNPGGPAIIHLETGYQEYWINGVQLNKEDSAKMHHEMMFNNDLNKLLGEE